MPLYKSSLNGEAMNDKSVTQTKHGQLEFTYPPSNQDLMDALADLNFVNNVIRMEKEIQRPMMNKVDSVM